MISYDKETSDVPVTKSLEEWLKDGRTGLFRAATTNLKDALIIEKSVFFLSNYDEPKKVNEINSAPYYFLGDAVIRLK